MKCTYTTKSGKIFTVTETYPQITEEEGKRLQKEAIMCVVKLLRDKQVNCTPKMDIEQKGLPIVG